MLINVTRKQDLPSLKAIQYDGTLECATLISTLINCEFNFSNVKTTVPSSSVKELRIMIDGNWRYVSLLDYIVFLSPPMLFGPIHFNRYYQGVK